ncbi:MAG: zinc ribbon domain-containing protein [Ruminococcus sp.]
MYCYYCGNLLQEDEIFCPKCGKKAKEIRINLDHLNYVEEIFEENDEVVTETKDLSVDLKEIINTDKTEKEKKPDNTKTKDTAATAKKVVVRIKPKKK